MAKNRVLVIEDDPQVRLGIREYFQTQGYNVVEAVSLQQAEEILTTTVPDAALLGDILPDGNALDLLPKVRELGPGVPVLILTAHGSIDLAVRAIKEGAEQFLTKPVDLKALHVLIERLLENQRNRRKQLASRPRPARGPHDPFLGTSDAVKKLADEAQSVHLADSPILLMGETGTGKGVLAAWLHRSGPRSNEAFVDLNCGGLNEEFLGSELFGHERGAFTGAVAPKQGLLELAHHGTMFLDEISDMDLRVQTMLLKVLEEKRIRKLGGVVDRSVDVHLIAATHEKLSALVAEKKFREDLFFRINMLPLHVPPLRERREDIPILARELLTVLGSDFGRNELRLSPDAEPALLSHAWPGNIRELRNVLESAVLRSRGTELKAADLRFEAPAFGPDSTDLTLDALERRHIARVLAEEAGRVEAAAQRLGIPRSTLYVKIKRHGLASHAR